MSEIHYPAGIKPKAEIPHKTPTKSKRKLTIAAGNRGMDFESEITETNLYYREKGLALFDKRPTPINVVKVDYTHGPKITEAYFEAQSTTDYNGVYKGKYVDFEAKSIHGKTSFPLSNIPKQQIEHLKEVLRQGMVQQPVQRAQVHHWYRILLQDFCYFPRKFLPGSEDLLRPAP